MPDYAGVAVGVIKELISVATTFIPQPKIDEKTILTDLEAAEINSERLKLVRVLMNEVKEDVKCSSCRTHIEKAEEELTYLEKEVPRIERVTALRTHLRDLLEEAQKEMKLSDDVEPLEPLLEEKTTSPSISKSASASIMSRDTTSHSTSNIIPNSEKVKSACVPCAIGHFTGSAKLLQEAVRFKKDGLSSPQVMDDIAEAIAEQNALERIDLTPAKIRDLPESEKEMANKALVKSRELRHKLETVENMDQLELYAAETEAFYKELNRGWLSKRLAKIEEKNKKSLSVEIAK